MAHDKQQLLANQRTDQTVNRGLVMKDGQPPRLLRTGTLK